MVFVGGNLGADPKFNLKLLKSTAKTTNDNDDYKSERIDKIDKSGSTNLENATVFQGNVPNSGLAQAVCTNEYMDLMSATNPQYADNISSYSKKTGCSKSFRSKPLQQAIN